MHFIVHPLACRGIFPISSLCSGVINEKLEKEAGPVDEVEINQRLDSILEIFSILNGSVTLCRVWWLSMGTGLDSS